jgi:transposase
VLVPYPEEFRRDVIAVARQADRSRAQVARSFGISEACLAQWLQIPDREHNRGDAPVPVLAAAGDLEAENRELRRRTKQLEQENEILRRGDCLLRSGHAPTMMFPLVLDLAAEKIPWR